MGLVNSGVCNMWSRKHVGHVSSQTCNMEHEEHKTCGVYVVDIYVVYLWCNKWDMLVLWHVNCGNCKQCDI